MLLLVLALAAEPASQPASQPSANAYRLDTVSVLGTPIEQAHVGGAAYKVDEKKLTTFGYTDVHRAIAEAPGVYVREEDGFGLRPNIGLRGASSDRSAKITLMEDGVLLAPAPYAAPAAYYFPMMGRITGLEVFKGPAAIKYGPHTVGGALNLLTRPVPRAFQLGVDASAGMYGTANLHAFAGTGGDLWGVLVEAAVQHSDGFKRLPSQATTGFDRGELVLKASANTPIGRDVAHQWDVKVAAQYELSQETYLGLSDADFARDPYARYAASQNDLMRSWRTQAQASYQLIIGEMWELAITAYRHDQSRQWKKVNGIEGAPLLASVFASPDSAQNSRYIAVLRGDADSGPAERVLIGTNDRRFIAHGVQATAAAHPVTGPVKQDVELSLRFHHDQVDRVHDDFAYRMQDGQPVLDDPVRRFNANNLARAFALAAYVQDQIAWKRLLVVPGVRLEYVHTDYAERLGNTQALSDTVAVLPGIGAYYGIIEELGVLAGVHRGFSPRAPGQSGVVEPEYSVNYEAGARAKWRGLDAEVIGFVNDYQNLTSECTFSSGCAEFQVNQQFNGGAVLVYGLEAAAKYTHRFQAGVEVRAQASYTLTLSQFQTGFNSQNPQWGAIERGDALPYVPVHQASATLGVSMEHWGVDATLRYNGEMRDIPGQGPIAANERLPAYAFVDLAAFVAASPKARITATLENVGNTATIASRRPFGARPGKPIMLLVGLRFSL